VVCGEGVSDVCFGCASDFAGFQRGTVVGAAIVAWAEAIRANTMRGRCAARESGGVRCELVSGHGGNHACPKALSTFVTEVCRAREHGECLSYICGCPCHD
jgi:hypothetical protein